MSTAQDSIAEGGPLDRRLANGLVGEHRLDMDEPARVEASKGGGGFGGKCCRCLKCEPWWSANPLVHCW